jgi:hypothetical protein
MSAVSLPQVAIYPARGNLYSKPHGHSVPKVTEVIQFLLVIIIVEK